MEKLRQSVPLLDTRVPPGTFMRGFTNGAGSGALMMGIFYTGMLLAGLTSFGIPMALSFGIGVLSTGLFSGIMASKRSAEQLDAASTLSHPASRHAPTRSVAPAQEHATPIPVMASATEAPSAEPQKRWSETVRPHAASGQDRVQQILTNGSLSDKERASAILAEREAAQHAQHTAR